MRTLEQALEQRREELRLAAEKREKAAHDARRRIEQREAAVKTLVIDSLSQQYYVDFSVLPAHVSEMRNCRDGKTEYNVFFGFGEGVIVTCQSSFSSVPQKYCKWKVISGEYFDFFDNLIDAINEALT